MIRRPAASGGWVRIAAAAAAGAFATLALPPLGAVPALAVAVVVLIRLLDGIDRFRSAFAAGFAFASAYFAVSLYWVAWSFLVPGPPVAYFGPAAVLLLSVLLACFLALPVAVAVVATRPGAARAFGVATALALGDWLRGHLLTGFPWNLFGHSWSQIPAVEQTASVAGVYGLGFGTLVVCALFSLRNWRAWAGACLAVALAAVWGHWRMSAPPVRDTAEGPLLRLVQPNVPQREKWRPGNREGILMGMIALGEPEGAPLPDAVIWPETAVPLMLSPDSGLLRSLGTRIGSRSGLILGVPLREDGRQYNSVVAIDQEGRTVARHDKAHLVPFGEYVPLRRLLGPLKLTAGRRDFTPGPGLTTMTMGGIAPFSALVCYEVIFPGEVVVPGNRPGWLLNLTNDAWYGETAGPHQHFENARMRSVETGLPLVRVANTGISGVADGLGRVVGRLGLGERGHLDIRLPPALPPPPYARLGDWPFLGALLAAILLVLAFGRRRKAPRRG